MKRDSSDNNKGNHSALIQDLTVSTQVWSQFDLDSRRPILDRTATQCQSAKDQSLAARKTLSEITKKFKKMVKTCENAIMANAALSSDSHSKEIKSQVEQLASQCRSVVKSYQEEIDKLTRRCKASDSAFLNLYQSMYELPDPGVLFRSTLEYATSKEEEVERLMSQVQSLLSELDGIEKAKGALEKDLEEVKRNASNDANNEELIALRKEIAEYELEFRGLKNQDITIRKLEAKITQLQQESEKEIAESLKKAQAQLNETEGRRASEALEREAKMECKVQSLELELRAERAGRAAMEERDLAERDGEGEREAAWEAQRQILVDDSERLREMLYDVQRERDDLRLKLDMGVADSKDHGAGKPGMANEFMAERKAYEAEVSELSMVTASLRDELKRNDDNMKQVRASMQVTIDNLETKCADLSNSVNVLKSQISNAPSQVEIDNMKRELRILKRLEYNAEDQDMDIDMDVNNFIVENTKDPDMTSNDLEAILVKRLRHMEANLLREKREKNEAEFNSCELAKCDTSRNLVF